MNPAPTFDRVYGAIKRRIMDGEWRPGERVDLASLADGLSASITPVRDAMNRLVGERLLATGITEGFSVPALTEPDLRDLYSWNQKVLDSASRDRPRAGREPFVADDRQDLVRRIGTACAAIAMRAQNREYIAAVDSLNDRLHAIRRIEAQLLSGMDHEVADLEAALSDGGMPTVRRRLAAFHRKRVQSAGELVYALHRAGVG